MSILSKNISPKNVKQARYAELLNMPKPTVVIASGAAGSGKTLFATHVGMQKLHNGNVDKLIITRPTVSVDENIGFLPGKLEEKMAPWTRPIFDVLYQYYPKTKVERMLKDNVIEISPLGYMRGRTFSNSWIICDEAQNTTINQMLMILTRIGRNSKMIITGDPLQYDRGFERNGLSDLLDKLHYNDRSDHIQMIQFEEKDVERHEVIPIILEMYK
jgi:phosphate starvation-inducible PhoH-like protein